MRLSAGWLLLAFVADLFSLFVLADAVGAWWTLGWVLAAMVLGVVVILDAGDTVSTLGGVFATPSERVEAIRETPWLLLAGVLFFLPGLVSDVLAVLLWLPAARRRLVRPAVRAQAAKDEAADSSAGLGAGRARDPGQSVVIEGEWAEKRDDKDPGLPPRP